MFGEFPKLSLRNFSAGATAFQLNHLGCCYPFLFQPPQPPHPPKQQQCFEEPGAVRFIGFPVILSTDKKRKKVSVAPKTSATVVVVSAQAAVFAFGSGHPVDVRLISHSVAVTAH